ncbi:MAG: MiaB/RimO family radical SAM methylthiotransferase [Longimicrobiales bacterium]
MPHRSSKLPTAWVETYGCQMNVSDGELMQGILAARGFELAASPEQADVILVNTCAIREHAEQRVLGRVGELNRIKRDRPDVVLGVTGCMAQRMGETLLDRAPYVDLVMGPDGYRSLPDVLARIRPAKFSTDANEPARGASSRDRRKLPVLSRSAGETVLDFTIDENYEGLEVHRTSRVSAWVPVQRGCNHRCTFCIVPYVRGPEKNRDPERVLDEVRGIAASGITEVVLLGQTVNSWTWGDWSFSRLLREVARVDGIRRVRFTSPHPNDVSPELVEVMASEAAVCNQLHLPVQSGHDRTLKRMLRRYTVAQFMDTVQQVRSAIPAIALSTDVIVAFPGETDEEYEATLDLLRAVRFDDAYLYRYSLRDGTPAARFPRDQFVASEVAQGRLERVIEMQRAISAEINAGEVGRELEVLVEREARSAGDMLGRTAGNKVAAFPGAASLIGQYAQVRLTSTTGATFRAEHRVRNSLERVA